MPLVTVVHSGRSTTTMTITITSASVDLRRVQGQGHDPSPPLSPQVSMNTGRVTDSFAPVLQQQFHHKMSLQGKPRALFQTYYAKYTIGIP